MKLASSMDVLISFPTLDRSGDGRSIAVCRLKEAIGRFLGELPDESDEVVELCGVR